MAGMVDCRKCRYFTPIDQLGEYTIKQALKWVQRHRPGDPLIGWCDKRKKPVTYARGYCSLFEAKPPKEYPKITDYAGGGE